MTSRRGFLTVALLGAAACARPLSAFAQHGTIQPGPIALAGATTIPFVLSGNIIYFKARIGRTPWAFIFDTGGVGTVTPELQSRWKFDSIGQAMLRGVGDDADSVDVVRVPEVVIGSAVYTAGPFIVMPSPFGPSNPFPDTPFGGILGRELFTRLVTTIDYERALLSFRDPNGFTPDASAYALALAMRGGAIPNVSAAIDGHAGRFDVDSGAGQAVTLTAKFADESGALKGFDRRIDALIGRGAGGVLMGTACRGRRFTLGGAELLKPVVTVAHSHGGVFDDATFDGNIGGEVLRRFTVTLDVPHSKLYLRPNRTFAQPFAFNRAGVFCHIQEDGQIVDFVVPGGPAATADIAAGDRITKLDGRAASSLSPATVTAIWQRAAGTKVDLSLERLGRRRNAVITLRDLI